MDKEVRDQKEAEYGDSYEGHRNLGIVWTGLLQNHFQGLRLPATIPPDVVMLMMAAAKINRAVTSNKTKQDNFVDGRNYLTLAEEAQEKKERTGSNA
jgi:hypothetical protein